MNNDLDDALFNSIKGDNYNLSLIYHYNYNSIKIKHLTKYQKNKIICIFGVLVNLKGIIIERQMLEWLMPEYDIYCIYQKYPGKLYEYPYFRFAQWISQKLNKIILLYLHTKGAFRSTPGQIIVRKLWMNEFIYPRNKVYIQPILKNKTDISVPFREGKCTWYNGMFISKRAFDLIQEVPFKKERFYYERDLFNLVNIRIKGILKDNQKPSGLGKAMIYHLEIQKKQKNEINLIIQNALLLGFILIIKLLVNNHIKIFKYKRINKQIPLKLIINKIIIKN